MPGDIYILLIHEQKTYHHELRNAQLHHPQKYKLRDKVFAGVQVQSNKSKQHVQKLTYYTQGPYKIINLYPSSSYDLKSTKSPSQVKSSEYQFGTIHKSITSNLYQNAAISKFNPAKPWAAPAAYADLLMEPFPSISESIPSQGDSLYL
jgi:hypothetical protein